jgi:FkbM family methyltransferase
MNRLSRLPEFRETSLFRSFEKAPLGFLDIGARGGVHEIVEPFAELTSVLGFEPDPEECSAMKRDIERTGSPFAGFDLEPSGLAEHEGSATLHRLSAATNDSLREPNPGCVERYDMVKWRRVGELAVPVTTLDDVVFGRRKDDPAVGEFIKIDTQGTELEILRGGARTLAERTVAVLAEVSFAELYQGQGRFSEVEEFLRDKGFAFYGFELFRLRSCNALDKRTHWSRERMIQADAVFFKDPLPGDRLRGGAISTRGRDCLLVTAVLLEYYEFALELAAAHYEAPDRQLLGDWITSAAELDLAGEARDIMELAATARNHHEQVAIAAGGFVDARRKRNDVAFWTSRAVSRPEQ